jgi:hypothetical protein
MANCYRAPGGWTVQVIHLRGTSDNRDGEWFRVRLHGWWDVRTPACRRAFDGLLWRWLSLHWSIPVSSGYGRRLRFLVIDNGHHGKVIGLIGLADPVFALGARESWVGWDAPTRSQRLANVMDAYVLGAVPPYSGLLGGKLVALLATSIREAFSLALVDPWSTRLPR